jgi:hypothetical protein
MLEGRIGPGWDQLGARTSDEDLSVILKRLKKRPLDYFKHSFYADTAVFGGVPATHAGLAFYDLDKICLHPLPLRSRKRPCTSETLRLRRLDMPQPTRKKFMAISNHYREVQSEALTAFLLFGVVDARHKAGMTLCFRLMGGPSANLAPPMGSRDPSASPNLTRDAQTAMPPLPDDGAISGHQGRPSRLPAVLPDG